jgi:DNA-binding transcriptional ArsR family regulator
MARLGKELGVMGKEMGRYIKTVIGDVMRGVDQTLRASVFVGPHGRTIRIEDTDLPDGTDLEAGDPEARPIRPVPPEEAQQLLSPLASAERVKILYLLSDGAMYHQDLMRESGLAPGTLPHHLKQLEEAGYVTQERVRGRYLITIPGRMALKLVEYLYFQMHTGFEVEGEEEE